MLSWGVCCAVITCAQVCAVLSPLPTVLGMQPPLPPEAVRELVCSCLHRDPVAADLRCSLFVAAAQNYKRDSLLRPFPPRYVSGDNKDFEELVRHSDSQKLLNTLCCSNLCFHVEHWCNTHTLGGSNALLVVVRQSKGEGLDTKMQI